jgi:hypothetical protein
MFPTKVAVEQSMRLIPAFFILLLTIPTTALACLSSTEPAFDRMIKDSTLIVRGEVLRESGDNQWLQGQKQHASDVLVDRAYKGTPSNVIRVSWKEYFGCPRARLDQKDYGLFFLRASRSEFELVDEQYGRLAASRSQDDSGALDPIVAIERDFKWAIQNDSGRQLIEDVLLLGSLRRPIGTAEIRALLPTKDEVLESAIHLALLQLHDYSELAAAGRLVETVPETRNFFLPKQEAAYLRTKIGGEITRIEDPGQLSVLQGFSLSSNYWLRQNATYALRHLHDFSNVRYLIRLIDDPSEETRIQAMRGLQELLRPGLEGYGWVPPTPLTGTEVREQEVIARWRAWWKAEGESRYGK